MTTARLRSVEVVTLSARDVEASAAFYRWLGFELASRNPHEVVLQRGTLLLVLQPGGDVVEADSSGAGALELHVTLDELEAMVGRMNVEPGATTALPGVSLHPDGWFEATLQDPSGYPVRLVAALPDERS
ncbi:MAG: hypothetical protein NZ898_04625 [Myxococcota bacterium]|nr:hypothetical protein [Myxococcota bacterium]MDW8362023.1 VOC family protein [Myxococcales bacterium]